MLDAADFAAAAEVLDGRFGAEIERALRLVDRAMATSDRRFHAGDPAGSERSADLADAAELLAQRLVARAGWIIALDDLREVIDTADAMAAGV